MKNLKYIVTLLLLFPLTANAFVAKKTKEQKLIRWQKAEVHYFISQKLVSELGESSIEAIQKAYEVWQKGMEGKVKFVYKGLHQDATKSYNKENVEENFNLVYLEDNWKEDPNIIALTFTTHNQATGEIIDSDIALNNMSYKWKVVVDGDKEKEESKNNDPFVRSRPLMDIQNTMAHEVGHFLGLDHSKDEKSTMSAAQPVADISKRVLREDDVQGIKHMYLETAFEQPIKKEFNVKDIEVGDVGFGCEAVDNKIPFWFVALMLPLFGMLLRRKTTVQTQSIRINKEQ